MIYINIGAYAKSEGLNKEEYKQLKADIKIKTREVYNNLEFTKGIYSKFLLNEGENRQIKYFIIQELKDLGIEFNNDYSTYRK